MLEKTQPCICIPEAGFRIGSLAGPGNQPSWSAGNARFQALFTTKSHPFSLLQVARPEPGIPGTGNLTSAGWLEAVLSVRGEVPTQLFMQPAIPATVF